MYFNKGKTIKEITEIKRLNYRTVKKWLDADDFNPRPVTYSRENHSDCLRPLIRDCFGMYTLVNKKHQLRTAESIYLYLRDTLKVEIKIGKRRFRTLVKEERQKLGQGDTVYLELTHPGGEAQVDFAEILLESNNELIKKHCLLLSFPYSNAGYCQITESQQSEALFEGLAAIFEHIGKVPTRIWFDQMSTAALRDKDQEGNVVMSKSLARFSAHYNFESVFCNPNSGNEKGNVEGKVGYYRRNFINTNRELKDLDEMNKDLLRRCDADFNRIHYKKKVYIHELFEQEKEKMRLCNPKPIDMSRIEKRKVDKYGHISHETNRYSVSAYHVNTWVSVKIGERELVIYDNNAKVITRHKRRYDKSNTYTHWLDFIDTLRNRPRALKYSDIYELFPSNWKTYFNTLDTDQTRSALSFFKHCLIHHDLSMAERVLAAMESTSTQHTEALWTTLYRLLEKKEMFEDRLPESITINIPAYNTSFNDYDKLMIGVYHEK